MKKRLSKSRLLIGCLLLVLALFQSLSIDGKTQRAKSKIKDECAKCPSSNLDGKLCLDCPVPENIDPNSDKPIPMGFPCCGRSRDFQPLSERATHIVEPPYPEEAKQKGIYGSVVVEVTIDKDGKVLSARALYGHEILREPALEAAMGWLFTPTKLKGKPVKVIGTITFNFKDNKETEKSS